MRWGDYDGKDDYNDGVDYIASMVWLSPKQLVGYYRTL